MRKILTLSSILLLATIIRLVTLQYGIYLHEYDPYFNYKVTDYLIQNGLKFFTWHDKTVWYPYGRNISSTCFPGMMILTYTIQKILTLINLHISTITICFYFPVVAALFTIIACYILAQLLFNENSAFLCAFLFAICPAFLSRSIAGFYDYECLSVGLILMCFWCWLSDRTSLLIFFYVFLAGCWGGYVFVMNLVGIHALAMLLILLCKVIIMNFLQLNEYKREKYIGFCCDKIYVSICDCNMHCISHEQQEKQIGVENISANDINKNYIHKDLDAENIPCMDLAEKKIIKKGFSLLENDTKESNNIFIESLECDKFLEKKQGLSLISNDLILNDYKKSCLKNEFKFDTTIDNSVIDRKNKLYKTFCNKCQFVSSNSRDKHNSIKNFEELKNVSIQCKNSNSTSSCEKLEQPKNLYKQKDLNLRKSHKYRIIEKLQHFFV
ncbi:Dolichyl-diphosphooligosaccharide--protein glycosyltransferase subunit stt3b, partial [Conglomerata obtusa]